MTHQQKKALLILGMHRSGTSALTRVCNLLGVELGNRLMPPAPGNNDTGFWEHEDIVAIHERLLLTLHSCWDDTQFLEDKWWRKDAVKPFKAEIIQLIHRDFSSEDFWGIKDPRLCRVLPLWIEILQELNITPYFIISIRNPFDVMMSLKKRDGFPEVKSLLLWLQHFLEVEKWSRQHPRVYVSYEELLQHPDKTTSHIAERCGFIWPVSYEEAQSPIISFLAPALQHFSHSQADYVPSQIKLWIQKIMHIAEEKLLKEGEDTTYELSALYQEITEQSRNWEEVSGFWREEAIQSRSLIEDYKKQIHTLSARTSFLEEQLQKQQEALIEKKRSLSETEALLSEMRRHHQVLENAITHLNHTIHALVHSTSWKVTAPLRWTKNLSILARWGLDPRTYKYAWKTIESQGAKKILVKVWFLLKNRGLQGAVHHLKRQVATDIHYSTWIEKYEKLSPADEEAIQAQISTLPYKPLISVVMPVYNIEEKWLRPAIESVLDQYYPHWELCIADDCSSMPHIRTVLTEYSQRDSRIKVIFRTENGHISTASNDALSLATGEFIALLDHDDLLTKEALYYIAHTLNHHPDADVVYSDEDKLDEKGGRYGPYFKSDWNPDLFFSQNMICHLGVYRHSLVKEIGGFRKGYEGSQDYDLALRVIAKTTDDKIHHVPRILYHWRAVPGSTAFSVEAKSYAVTTSRKAITDFLEKNYPGAQAEDGLPGNLLGYHRIRWPLPSPEPKVTLIIPTRDRHDLVRMCVESIHAQTAYKNFEILLVDNQSSDPESLTYFQHLAATGQARVVVYDQPFNFSALNNFAVRHTDAAIVAFINNDIEVISPNWLSEMVSHALRPGIGAVGAKLYYPNDTIQHAGVVTGIGNPPVAGHIFHGMPYGVWGYGARNGLTQSLTAVTGACLLMPRVIFEEIGGFEEDHLKVAFNDIDLCLRIREKGYRVIWTPYAELYHHESASRGYETTPEKKERFLKEAAYMRSRWGDILDNDPYYNPNLDLTCGDFSLAFPPRVRKPWEEEAKKR